MEPTESTPAPLMEALDNEAIAETPVVEEDVIAQVPSIELVSVFKKDLENVMAALPNVKMEAFKTLSRVFRSIMHSWKLEDDHPDFRESIKKFVEFVEGFRESQLINGMTDDEITDGGLPDLVRNLDIALRDFLNTSRAAKERGRLIPFAARMHRIWLKESKLHSERAKVMRSRKNAAQQVHITTDDDLLLSSKLSAVITPILPTQAERDRKSLALSDLTSAIHTFAPNARCDVFGSSSSGLGFAASDVDVALHPEDFASLNSENLRKSIKLETLQSDLGFKEREASIESAEEWLAKLKEEGVIVLVTGQVLRESASFDQVETISTARVPVVKMIHRSTQIQCDVAVGNALAVHNTALLRRYGELSSDAKMMILCVKFWAKKRGIGDASLGFLSSYAWTLLALFYLQRCPKQLGGSVLPNLQTCDSKDEGKLVEETIEGFKVRYVSGEPDTKAMKHMVNAFSHGALLRGFFTFYVGSFSMMNDSVGFDDSTKKRKANDTTRWRFTIIDPFELTHDLGTTLAGRRAQTIINEEIWRAFNLLAKDNGKGFWTEESASAAVRELFAESTGIEMTSRPCVHCGESGHRSKQCTMFSSTTVSDASSRCFMCGSKSHLAKDCPQRDAERKELKKAREPQIVCYKCGQKGHYAKDCPGPKGEPKPRLDLTNLRTSSREDDAPRKEKAKDNKKKRPSVLATSTVAEAADEPKNEHVAVLDTSLTSAKIVEPKQKVKAELKKRESAATRQPGVPEKKEHVEGAPTITIESTKQENLLKEGAPKKRRERKNNAEKGKPNTGDQNQEIHEERISEELATEMKPTGKSKSKERPKKTQPSNQSVQVNQVVQVQDEPAAPFSEQAGKDQRVQGKKQQVEGKLKGPKAANGGLKQIREQRQGSVPGSDVPRDSRPQQDDVKETTDLKPDHSMKKSQPSRGNHPDMKEPESRGGESFDLRPQPNSKFKSREDKTGTNERSHERGRTDRAAVRRGEVEYPRQAPNELLGATTQEESGQRDMEGGRFVGRAPGSRGRFDKRVAPPEGESDQNQGRGRFDKRVAPPEGESGQQTRGRFDKRVAPPEGESDQNQGRGRFDKRRQPQGGDAGQQTRGRFDKREQINQHHGESSQAEAHGGVDQSEQPGHNERQRGRFGKQKQVDRPEGESQGHARFDKRGQNETESGEPRGRFEKRGYGEKQHSEFSQAGRFGEAGARFEKRNQPGFDKGEPPGRFDRRNDEAEQGGAHQGEKPQREHEGREKTNDESSGRFNRGARFDKNDVNYHDEGGGRKYDARYEGGNRHGSGDVRAGIISLKPQQSQPQPRQEDFPALVTIKPAKVSTTSSSGFSYAAAVSAAPPSTSPVRTVKKEVSEQPPEQIVQHQPQHV